MDISLALKRFSSLQNNTKKSDSIFKPANGKSQVRIVPYKFNKDIPFIELYFHYNINNKTYLSPASFFKLSKTAVMLLSNIRTRALSFSLIAWNTASKYAFCN